MHPDNAQNMAQWFTICLKHGGAVESVKTKTGWRHAVMTKDSRCCQHVLSGEHRNS